MEPEEKKKLKFLDKELRLLTDVIIQYEHHLVYVREGEFLKDAGLTCFALMTLMKELPTQELVQVPNSGAVTLSIGKLNNIIKCLAKNTGERSQQLFDSLKSLLRMDAGCQIQLPNGKVLSIFGPTKDYKCPETWLQSVVRQANALVRYTQSDLGFKSSHILAIALLIFMVSWSIADMWEVKDECRNMQDLTETDKREYLEFLNNMDAILTEICNELNSGCHARLDGLFRTLIDETTKLISKIDISQRKIEENIEKLKKKESNRALFRDALFGVSGFAFFFTWNYWKTMSVAQRAASVLGSGAVAGGAVTMMISVYTLTQALNKQAEVLKNLKELNTQLSKIQDYLENLEYEPADHVVILIQFEDPAYCNYWENCTGYSETGGGGGGGGGDGGGNRGGENKANVGPYGNAHGIDYGRFTRNSNVIQ
ncbi:8970_t:CDS:2 [Ambispora leptoticha]|uniref:8970_t:CDS:1 n=1 Tax=Ambispora leptoticha TaxID=144679 RepID=A0A9N9GU58_9GLOM|nr:8970_t:CDS:2 [Ambispora leptoticha]